MIEIKRSFYDWIRKWILRKTATPYECYWRDRAFRAEKALGNLASAAERRSHHIWYAQIEAQVEAARKVLNQ